MFLKQNLLSNRDLLDLSNLICSPHIGAQTKEGQELASTVIAEKIIQKIITKDDIHQ